MALLIGDTQRAARLRRYAVGYLFIAPIVLFFLAFVLYPFLRSFYISLTRWAGYGSPEFVGLHNFDLMLHDSIFWGAFKTTLMLRPVSAAVVMLNLIGG